jgi:hypothetical protein
MRARTAAGCVTLAIAAATPGCLRTAAFECVAESDCIDAGVAGRCEPNGFCSFPDAGCESGQRYGDHAGNGLGGLCVPEDGSTGIADDGGTTESTTTGSTSVASLDTTPLSVGSESSSASSFTTAPADTSTTTDESTSDPTDAESSSTSGGVVPQCPSFVDDFEDGMLDASWTTMDGQYVTEANGELTFELTPAADAIYPGVLRSGQDLTNGYVRIRLGDVPSGDGTRLYLAVAIDENFGDVVYIMIEGAQLLVQREQAGQMMFETIATVQYDAMEHAWLQIRGEGDTLWFETSPDNAAFVPAASVDTPFALTDTTVIVAATNYLVLQVAAFHSVLDFEMCAGA